MSSPPAHPSNIDLLVALARLEAKVDQAITQKADHETRIRALEGRPQQTPLDVHGMKLPIVGVLSLIGAAGAAAATFLGG